MSIGKGLSEFLSYLDSVFTAGPAKGERIECRSYNLGYSNRANISTELGFCCCAVFTIPFRSTRHFPILFS